MNTHQPNKFVCGFRRTVTMHIRCAALAAVAVAASWSLTDGASADWMPEAIVPPVPELEAPELKAPEFPVEDAASAERTGTIYRADASCRTLEPQTVALDVATDAGREAEIEAAIAVVFSQWTGKDLEVTGYRVVVRDRVAVVDLRRDTDAARPWLALSTCEQFALFGGLRETIVQNSEWAIEQVEFRSLSEPLAF